MINIYINNGERIPDDETCYIIGKDGIMLKKTLDLIESLTPVDKISFLEPIPTYARMKIPIMPVVMLANIVGFFREVYRLFHSEAVVLLFYNLKTKCYKVYVPSQEVAPAGLDYKTDKTIKDHRLIGTIHSHASMTAFHSGIDKGDEAKFDGIHLTIGKMGSEFFDICGSIAVNGMRVAINPEEYIEGLETREYTNYFPQMFRPAFEFINDEKVYKNEVKSNIGYVLNTNEENFKFDPAWILKVKEKTYENLYEGYSGGTRYTFKDGKLVKIAYTKREPIQTSFDYRSILFPNLSKIEKETKDECVCKKCLHRCDKLKLEDFSEVAEKDLTELFYGTDNWWQDGFSD
jgi:hypothetical protein